jgi:hypothetical protein
VAWAHVIRLRYLLISTEEGEPCYRTRYEHPNDATRSGHLATPAGLGIASSRLVEQGYRGGPRSQRGVSESVADPRARGRWGRAAEPAAPWRPPAAHGGATRRDPGPVGPWSRTLRVSG